MKNQIGERITIENKKFSQFIDNQLKRHVYVVEDFLGYSIGFFLNYDKAMKYAREYAELCKENYWDTVLKEAKIASNILY